MAKGKKRGNLFFLLQISFICILLFRMILLHITQGKGVAYFSVANELFFLLGFSLSYGFEKSISLLIGNRMSRNMYENAKGIMNGGIILALFVGLFIDIFLFLLRNVLYEKVFEIGNSSLVLSIMLPAILFMLLSGVIRGFFDGSGNRMVLIISYYAFLFFYIFGGSIFSTLFFKYGEKVSSLLKVESIKYNYGSMGASIGILLASFLNFLMLLIFYFIYKKRTYYKDGRDYSQNRESIADAIVIILSNFWGPFLMVGVFFLSTFVNLLMYIKRNKEVEGVEFIIGEYYGKVFPIVFIILTLVLIFTNNYSKKALKAVSSDEFRMGREKLSALIHTCITIGAFTTSMLVVLSDDLIHVLYSINGSDTLKFLRTEAFSIVTGLFAVVLIRLLFKLRYTRLTSIIMIFSFIIHILLDVLFILIMNKGFVGVGISNALTFLLTAMASFFYVSRAFQYTQEYIRSFGVSVIGALLSGVVGSLINNALICVISRLFAMLITLFISIVFYIVLLLALRGYTEEELEETKLGGIVLMIGKTLHLI